VPEFASEAEERAFRETHDSAGLVDGRRARPVRLTDVKPSATAIPLYPPSTLLERIIKLTANQRCVPYRTSVNLWPAEKVETSGRAIGGTH